MARKPRIHFPGAVYHVMLRGNDGQDIFFDSADRTRFLLLLQQGLERYHHRVHAYCLMTTHVHIALQVTETPLSKIMQNLGFRYTQYINRKLKRSGHLFQGRFKALLIDENSYLLELVRYIHLNPLRAGMVKDPSDYPWSSHGCYLGNRKTPWLTSDWILSQWDDEAFNAQIRYGEFVQDGLQEGRRQEFHRGNYESRALGDESFIERSFKLAEQSAPSPMTMCSILDAICDCYGVEMKTLSAPGRHQPLAEARALAAWLVRQNVHLQLKDLGARLNRDLSGLSQAARRIEHRIMNDVELRERLEQIRVLAGNSAHQACPGTRAHPIS